MGITGETLSRNMYKVPMDRDNGGRSLRVGGWGRVVGWGQL